MLLAIVLLLILLAIFGGIGAASNLLWLLVVGLIIWALLGVFGGFGGRGRRWYW